MEEFFHFIVKYRLLFVLFFYHICAESLVQTSVFFVLSLFCSPGCLLFCGDMVGFAVWAYFLPVIACSNLPSQHAVCQCVCVCVKTAWSLWRQGTHSGVAVAEYGVAGAKLLSGLSRLCGGLSPCSVGAPGPGSLTQSPDQG